MDPLHPANEARDARPFWMGFLSGTAILALSVLSSMAIWHFAGGTTPSLTTAELIEIEVLLDQLDFPPGPVDGAITQDTLNAIRDFQLTAGIEVDGAPSLALLDELRAAKAELSGN